MSASFHPADEMLAAYGAGSLDEGTAVLISTHLALCPRCRKEVARVEAMGGAMLEELSAAEMGEGALDSVLSRIASLSSPPPPPPSVPSPGPSFFPRPLRDYVGADLATLPWKRLAKGIEQVILLESHATRVRLLRIGAGVVVPEHGHGGMELTMALQGGFADQGHHYGRGDVAVADGATVHSPAADRSEPCICLAVTDAPLKLTGMMGRLLNPFLDL
jgi:putative transcriptional regulator